MTGTVRPATAMPGPAEAVVLVPLVQTEPCFSDEECARIIAEGLALPMQEGVTTGREIAPEARRSTISLFPPEQRYAWMIERIARVAADANQKTWRFDIARSERLQFSAYGADQYYDWHIDLGSRGSLALRKISVSVQLNDGADYDGGDLEISLGTTDKRVTRKKGTVILFPSYMRHRVLPVTRGIRYSLVAWLGGNAPFR
jgi:PKHD-type hydroxylase